MVGSLFGVLCWALLFLLGAVDIATAAKADEAFRCPVDYKRHDIKDIASGAVTPYLFGGIHNRTNCVNCKRGGLWPTFCGWKATGLKFYDLQLCSANITKAVVEEALQRDDPGPLTMTPCDMWYYMRGRTMWIVGYV
jgi:hypothetical protein